MRPVGGGFVKRDTHASRLDRPAEIRPLASRLRPPRAHVGLVVRETLIERLRETRAPLILVSAPAGYGKTTLLAQWAERDGRPFAWLQLAELHDDRVAFLTYLATAISGVADVDPRLVGLMRANEPPIEELILPALGSAVEAADPFLLVVDDAHLVGNPACWRYAGILLDQLPDGARLALASRGHPPVALPRLRAGGSVEEVRLNDLRLSRTEARAALALHGCDPTAQELEELLEATEGWATGIYLALLAGDDCPTGDLLTGVRGDRRAIAEYLTTEILDRQPAELQQFLLSTCILDRLSAGLCRTVTGRADAAALLDTLARDNLFVTPLDDHDESYRYHHLFRELLLAQLERRAPETTQGLHRRAAAWYETHGDGERSVRHSLACGTGAEELADLVARTCDEFLSAGQMRRAWRLLALFDDEPILSSPVLALTAATISSYVPDARAQRLGRQAMDMDVGDGPTPVMATSLKAWQAVLRASCAPDGVTRMREDSILARRLLETDANDWLDFATRMQAMACYLSGQVQRATAMCEEQRPKGSSDPEVTLWWLGLRALIAADQADWAQVAELDDAGRDLGIPEAILPPILAHALLLGHVGDPGALGYVETAGRDLLETSFATQWRSVLCADVFGEVALRVGDLPSAERWVTEAEAILARWVDAGTLRGRTKRLREALEERRMADPLTAAERRILDLLPTQLTARQLAARLFLTENTVKSHLSHIYRKLGVTTRTDAVETARRLGLL
jgi:LuxR family maltose regulon positive regulatory protein